MSKLSPARKLALDVLMEADRRGMYARDVLSSRASAKVLCKQGVNGSNPLFSTMPFKARRSLTY